MSSLIAQGAVLGYGTWPLGGQSYGAVETATALRSLKCADEAGIRFFDAADIYGDGRVEMLLQRAFGTRADIRILTKVGYLSERGSEQDFTVQAVFDRVRASARRLRREPLDIVLFHSPPREVLQTGEFLEVVERLRESGIAAELGVSLRSVNDIEIALALPDLRHIELIFNLLDQRAIDQGALLRAAAHGRHIVARLPLCCGFLSGKYVAGHVFDSPFDRRARWSRQQLDAWADGAARFEFLRQDARSLAQAALAFCLRTPGITHVIPGMKTPGQVLHNVAASTPGCALTEAEYAQARLVWQDLGHVVPQP